MEKRTGSPGFDASSSAARTLEESPIDVMLTLTDRLGVGAEADFEQALSLATLLLGMTYGIVSRIDGQDYRIEYLSQPDGAGLSVGQHFDLGQTYCALTMTADDVVSIDEVGLSEIAGHPCYLAMGLESYIGIPLRIDGVLYGTLNFSSSDARRRDWSEAERLLVRLLARWIESAIQQRRLNARLTTALRDLDHANAELVERNRDLDQFAHFASHDLQAPLRQLVSFSELLERDLAGELSDQAAIDLRMIQSSAGRMLSVVRGLLELSRAGRDSVVLTEVHLGDAVAAVLDELRDEIVAKGAEVEFGDMPCVRADRERLLQILRHLVSNALEYHAPGARPKVEILARSSEDGVRVSVRDNGIGIAAEDHAKVFAPFERIHSRAEHPGSGLGLAVCRKLVEMHGGELEFESEPGVGSTFSFILRR